MSVDNFVLSVFCAELKVPAPDRSLFLKENYGMQYTIHVRSDRHMYANICAYRILDIFVRYDNLHIGSIK